LSASVCIVAAVCDDCIEIASAYSVSIESIGGFTRIAVTTAFAIFSSIDFTSFCNSFRSLSMELSVSARSLDMAASRLDWVSVDIGVSMVAVDISVLFVVVVVGSV
jgi:hypothetical protein